jgi:hypothetical protein
MKNIRIALLLMALICIAHLGVKAQIRISFNVSSQPIWGPVEYDYVEYYYMPEYDIYYYAPEAQFIYWDGFEWAFTNTLPYQYRRVNLYSTYKVVINEPRPYLRNEYYAGHYKNYKRSHPKQMAIRDSRDHKYDAVRNRQNNSRNDNSRTSNRFNKRNEAQQQEMDRRGNDVTKRGRENGTKNDEGKTRKRNQKQD